MNNPELFIVMIDYGKIGREAIVDPNDNWSDALVRVREAVGDGNEAVYVRHIHDGVDEDRTQEALQAVIQEYTADPERDETEQSIINWLRYHQRDLRKHEVAL
jgi:hypothetical protein